MLIYVININGQPLMPTSRCSKVRKLLKNGKAKVVKRVPFTIQLLYETTNIVQEITLRVDSGSKVVGVSTTTKDKEFHSQEFHSQELYSGEFELRNDVVELICEKRQYCN